jgi:hypothetical protein
MNYTNNPNHYLSLGLDKLRGTKRNNFCTYAYVLIISQVSHEGQYQLPLFDFLSK